MADRRNQLTGIKIVIFILILLLSFSLASQAKTTLKVLNAGSLLVPFTALAEEFEALNPDIDVLIEGHGSIQVIRHVTEVSQLSGEPIADIVAVADYSLIPKLMYQTLIPDTQKAYANWLIQFATNSLGIAYTSQSKYANEINGNNWYQILSRPDVKLGIFDACGYRALMAMQLAEIYYEDDTILQGVMGDFSYPIKIEAENGQYIILVPEILEPERLAIRDSSIKLLFPLQSGDLDYAFEYKSVAKQHQMKFIEFPEELNLGTKGYEELCQDIRVKLAFRRFASVNPDFNIQPIIYGMTIPANAPHPEYALKLLQFMLSPKGQEIMQQNHQLTIRPAIGHNWADIPDVLKNDLVKE